IEAFDRTQKTMTVLPSRIEEIKQILAISKELHDILYQSLMNRSNIKGFRYEDIQKFQQTIERYNNTIGE
ncbi:MAG TPA: hypothetical protein VKX40_17205, partial [Aequorivita sp.]|nr:hypothetical protein [Aequorivita sp.]